MGNTPPPFATRRGGEDDPIIEGGEGTGGGQDSKSGHLGIVIGFGGISAVID